MGRTRNVLPLNNTFYSANTVVYKKLDGDSTGIEPMSPQPRAQDGASGPYLRWRSFTSSGIVWQVSLLLFNKQTLSLSNDLCGKISRKSSLVCGTMSRA